MKKVTDKMRLDWLTKANVTLYAYVMRTRKAFSFNAYLDGGELSKETYPSPRAAIDAAMKAAANKEPRK